MPLCADLGIILISSMRFILPNIPSKISGVSMTFAAGVDRNIAQNLLDAMQHTISSTAVPGEKIDALWVSSAKDSHKCPSRHVSGLAVDISRVNGKRISTHYGSDESVKAIVDGLQSLFESAPNRRENYGPTIQKKLGKDNIVGGHSDHFHWSVDGDHSVCAAKDDKFRLADEDTPQAVSQR